MYSDISIITNILVFVGAALLGIAFFPIRKLISQLPLGSTRQRWNFLSLLIIFFLFGYIWYNIAYWEKFDDHFDLVVTIIFLFGAIFVLLVGMLSLQTAKDINEIIILKRENIIDPLIGIYNRRYFDTKLSEEIERAHRYKLPLSLLLLDIDHFKNINDTHGHQIGDIVLKNLGQLLLKTIRETDIVARYGGEEIAIITPHTSLFSASELAERLRHTIEASTMVPADEYEKRQAIKITVSIGVTGMEEDSGHEKSMIKKADKALYEAKENGRNQVIVYKADINDLLK